METNGNITRYGASLQESRCSIKKTRYLFQRGTPKYPDKGDPAPCPPTRSRATPMETISRRASYQRRLCYQLKIPSTIFDRLKFNLAHVFSIIEFRSIKSIFNKLVVREVQRSSVDTTTGRWFSRESSVIGWQRQ